MKITPYLLIASCLIGPLFAQDLEEDAPSPEEMKKVSYAQGYDTGREVKANEQFMNEEKFLEGFLDVLEARVPQRDANAYSQGAMLAIRIQEEGNPFDAEATLKGIQDGLENKDIKTLDYTLEELEAANKAFLAYKQKRDQAIQEARQNKMREQLIKVAKENLEEGRTFLQENATKEGVNTTLTQLQFKVLREGEGKQPSEGDTVVVHYEGRLLNGTKFDSTIDKGKPANVKIQDGLILPGWVEGLQLMKEGSRYRFWLPAELAYGESPRPLGPNQTLEFDVELLEVK